MRYQRGTSHLPIILAIFFGAAVVVTIFGYMMWPKDKDIGFGVLVLKKAMANSNGNINVTNDNTNSSNTNAIKLNNNANPASDGCVKTGCSGEICSDIERYSTCDIPPGYTCYQSGICERQSDGNCGWTMTDQMRICLTQSGVKCPNDVKGCPGGSYVGRIQPDCAFAACPNKSSRSNFSL